MKKIYTIRNPEAQREHMWSARRIEEEIAACPRRSIARYFLDHLPKDAPILEAGCGLGAWVVYLGDRGYDIAGIDHDEKVVYRLKEWRPSLKISRGDIRELPYENGSLSAVISLGVMEHFEEGCGNAMRETHRVLRPGGLLFFTVPMDNLFRRVFAHPMRSLYLKWRKSRGETIHFAEYRFSGSEVETLLREHGFEPMITTWDDFSEKTMSLGIWADFPPLQSKTLYELNPPGKVLASGLNILSRWVSCSGIFSVARKIHPV
ncbi:MAG: methyltransferase domain-containing protein [Candidatus Deferrimicrobiaceae bacterium]